MESLYLNNIVEICDENISPDISLANSLQNNCIQRFEFNTLWRRRETNYWRRKSWRVRIHSSSKLSSFFKTIFEYIFLRSSPLSCLHNAIFRNSISQIPFSLFILSLYSRFSRKPRAEVLEALMEGWFEQKNNPSAFVEINH